MQLFLLQGKKIDTIQIVSITHTHQNNKKKDSDVKNWLLESRAQFSSLRSSQLEFWLKGIGGAYKTGGLTADISRNIWFLYLYPLPESCVCVCACVAKIVTFDCQQRSCMIISKIVKPRVLCMVVRSSIWLIQLNISTSAILLLSSMSSCLVYSVSSRSRHFMPHGLLLSSVTTVWVTIIIITITYCYFHFPLCCFPPSYFLTLHCCPS